MARVPAAKGDRYLAAGEEILITFHKHPAVLLGPAALFCLAIVAAAVLGFVTSPGDDNDFIDTVFGMAALVTAARLAWRLAHWWADRVYVTETRIFEVSGVLTRKVASMPLGRVTDMTYNRTIVGRLLGYGSLILESAGQQQGLSVIDHLPRPDDVYRRLTSLVCCSGRASDDSERRMVFQGVRIEDEDTGPLPRISL